jgi:hypothetical protein
MEKERELPRQRPTLPTATADGLLYERLDQALTWADKHDRRKAASRISTVRAPSSIGEQFSTSRPRARSTRASMGPTQS